MKYDIHKIVTKNIAILQNTYIVKHKNTHILIDAGASVEKIKAIIGEAVLDAVFITHCHFDHIFYLKEIAAHYKCKVYMHKTARRGLVDDKINMSFYVNVSLNFEIDKSLIVDIGDEKIRVKDISVQTFTTPGHSEDGMNYLIGDELFVGDTIFSDSIGRNDFPTSSVPAHIESLKKIYAIPFKNMYSGHTFASDNTMQKKNIKFWLNQMQTLDNNS